MAVVRRGDSKVLSTGEQWGGGGAGTLLQFLHLVTWHPRSGWGDGGDLQKVFVVTDICDPWKSHALTTHPLVLFWGPPRLSKKISNVSHLMNGISAIRQLGKLDPTLERRSVGWPA